MTNRELVCNFLQQEGYRFQEVENLFRFRAQGMNLVCEANDRDDMFIHIIAPVIYSMSNTPEVSRQQVLEVCNQLVAEKKVLKVCLDEDEDVSLSLELLISEDTNDLTSVLDRSLNILAQGRYEFTNRITKLIQQ